MFNTQFTTEQNKQLVSLYPYLIPQNLSSNKTSDEYDYTYICGNELPNGWFRLFLMYCKYIRPHLVQADYLYDFSFSQLKEKWGMMCLYNMGYPESIEYLTRTFEAYSKYVCSICGDAATVETFGWVRHLCNDCSIRYTIITVNTGKIKLPKHYKVTIYEKNYFADIYYSYKWIDKEYQKVRKMTDEEFWNYIIDVE